jgi:casein kinase 1
MEGTLLNNRYLIGPRIEGKVHKGLDLNGDIPVAIKVEPQTSKDLNLLSEARYLRILNGIAGVPHLYYAGIQDNYNYMVMKLVGPSIRQLLDLVELKFLTPKSALHVIRKATKILESIHEEGIVHQSINLSSICISLQSKTEIFITSFGQAKRYRINGKHITQKQVPIGEQLLGTCSLN